MVLLRNLFIIAASFLPVVCKPQAPVVKTYLDKDQILIGEQFKIKIDASYKQGAFKVTMPVIPDSIAHFEVVERGKPDTISGDVTNSVQQIITFTSFDSGKWVTPSLFVTFDPIKPDTTITVLIDSFPINVSYSPPDSSNQLRDIKPIREVTVKDYFWYYLIGGALLAIVIGWLVYRYIKNRKKKSPDVFVSSLSPFEEAMQSLAKLKELDLQNGVEIKQYHTHLSAIFKRYLSRFHNKNLMNKTTYDVLIHLTENGFVSDRLSKIAVSLRTGDAVKFAKYLPGTAESEQCLGEVKEAIHFIENSKPLNP